MAAASSLLYEDNFLCSICLDVFTDPVTIPCGHNFCKTCITQHWNIRVQCQCPLCNKSFDRRPELSVNTFISEMAAQFRQSLQELTSSSSERQQAKPGDVLCDVCTESKLRALKSCLVCLASYCEPHLEPHRRIPGLKRHELIDPVENLEGRLCETHERPLDLFCETDQMCVCRLCAESTHKRHRIVPLEKQFKAKKAELGNTEAEVQRMIQERRLKIEQIKQSVKVSKEDADREAAAGEQVVTALIRMIEKDLAQLVDTIEEEHKATESRAEGFVKELEEEISELMKRSAELEQLSATEDHLQFLQSFPSLSLAPPTKDWSEVSVQSPCEWGVRGAVGQLEEMLRKDVEKLCAGGVLKRLQQYAVDVTLDRDVANPFLMVSDDDKQVCHGNITQKHPHGPNIFYCYSVLGKQSFSSGRFYFEVQVKGKTSWIVGVVRESVNRKGNITLSPENGCWFISLMNKTECTAAGSTAHLFLKSELLKVGVFVDYEEGLVSFYDADSAALIHSFVRCDFAQKLFPYFNPCHNMSGINSTPLIICSINPDDQTDQ